MSPAEPTKAMITNNKYELANTLSKQVWQKYRKFYCIFIRGMINNFFFENNFKIIHTKKPCTPLFKKKLVKYIQSVIWSDNSKGSSLEILVRELIYNHMI